LKTQDLFTAVAFAIGLTVPVAAHHSHAMYDMDLSITLEGTVTEFFWGNPHSWLYISVTNESGEAVEWALETNPPWVLAEQGWESNSIQAGDEVSVTVKPLRRGIHGGQLDTVTMSDGREFSHD
jgi:hypothetical protein